MIDLATIKISTKGIILSIAIGIYRLRFRGGEDDLLIRGCGW